MLECVDHQEKKENESMKCANDEKDGELRIVRTT